MKHVFLAACILFFYQVSFAQETVIKGRIVDTLEKRSLPNAVIALISKKDSTLHTFTRADKSGAFQVNNLPPGLYQLLVSFPKFADYTDQIEVNNQPLLDLGTIPLTLKSTLLKEVVIKSGQAIRIKGDTTEFTADSFVVREGATVEELLKKLPGFQVNAKGEITAQGQRVQKVLVDGEEFFGDDPTMATQNISAKAVDKVQVFDHKSEQQQLTGISSGNEGKTVNIKLKEDKKKGSFGKIYSGLGPQKFNDSKGYFNRFVGKKKVALYASKTNIGAGSLNWEERNKLGVEDNMEYDEISGYYFSFYEDDGFNEWSMRGLPEAYTAGGLFSNKWNSDKQSLNTSYRFNRLGLNNDDSRLTQNILPFGVSYTNRFAKSTALNQQHAVDGKYEWNVDSLRSFKFITSGIYKTTDGGSNSTSEYLEDAELFNRSFQLNNRNTTRLQTDNSLRYKQLFRKKGRQLLVTLRYGLTADEQDGHLYSLNRYYNEGTNSRTDTVDQKKLFEGSSQTIGSKVTYNEPLSAKWNLILDYSFNTNKSHSNRNTYNRSGNGKYETLDPLFSNNFDLTAGSHSSMAFFKYAHKKLKLALGSGVSTVKLDLYNLDNRNQNTFHFLNITPQSQIGYAFKPQTNMSVRYRGTTRQPTINQLQPIRDNANPMNIFIGNPNLKVGFSHQLDAFFGSYKVLSATNIWINAGLNIHNNAITNSVTIDRSTEKGKQTYMPVNVNGNREYYYYGYWSKGEGDKKLRHTIITEANGGRNINFVNNQQNSTDYSQFTLGYGVSYGINEKYNFHIRPKVSYNTSVSSLNKQINTHYWSYGGEADAYVKLPGKVEVSSNIEFDLRQRLAAFNRNMNIIRWNANISRTLLKDKSAKIILQANDLLNQNRGFNRLIQSNFIEEERFSRVGQYFLLKLEWSFNKMPGSK